MSQNILKNKKIYLFPVLVFGFFTVWWLYLRMLDLERTRDLRQLWGATYQVLAFYGGIIGLLISQKWGGTKSVIGKIVLAFSVGLFLQVFGQSYSSYYVYRYHVESPPYPAVGDIGFFGSVIAYIYGVMLLARVSGVSNKMKDKKNQILVIVIPLIVLTGS